MESRIQEKLRQMYGKQVALGGWDADEVQKVATCEKLANLDVAPQDPHAIADMPIGS